MATASASNFSFNIQFENIYVSFVSIFSFMLQQHYAYALDRFRQKKKKIGKALKNILFCSHSHCWKTSLHLLKNIQWFRAYKV